MSNWPIQTIPQMVRKPKTKKSSIRVSRTILITGAVDRRESHNKTVLQRVRYHARFEYNWCLASRLAQLLSLDGETVHTSVSNQISKRIMLQSQAAHWRRVWSCFQIAKASKPMSSATKGNRVGLSSSCMFHQKWWTSTLASCAVPCCCQVKRSPHFGFTCQRPSHSVLRPIALSPNNGWR